MIYAAKSANWMPVVKSLCTKKGIAAGNGKNFSDPGTVILTVKNDLVVLELHGVNSSINPETVQG
jgi:hypothetical protein